jgi:hypothetical protein
VFENRVPRRIFGPKRDEVTGGWKKKLRNEELHDFFYSRSIITMMKLGRMGCVGRVARMGEEEYIQGFGGKARKKETTMKT